MPPVDLSDPRITVTTLPGGITSQLTITGVTIMDVGQYAARVNNSCGGPVVSTNAQLMFNAADVGQQGGIPPGDGLYDNNDFVVFIDRFFSGC